MVEKITQKRPLVSICIPTYNGAKTLGQTLDSILSQWNPAFELVLCDDCSTDNTLEIIRTYALKQQFIRVFQNTSNLGMDGNFRQVALHASTDFVWFSGQDDLFGEGALNKVASVITSKPELGVIYINFSQHNHDMSQLICKSMLHIQAFHPEQLDEEKDLLFNNAGEYFSTFDAAPTFLPATIVRKEYWLDTDVTAYVGTAFIQTAVILLNMNKRPIYVITRPMIRGRIPDDRWQAEGQSYFSIMLGVMTAEALVYQDSRNPIPGHVYRKRKNLFLRNFFALVRHSKRIGMQPTEKFYKSLQIIFGRGLIYHFILCPILKMPLEYLDSVHGCYRWAREVKTL